jgi:hypothetical protein
MTPLPRFTRHAEERWAYRCGTWDRSAEWARARRVSSKRLARLNHHSGNPETRSRGCTHWLSPAGVLFVVAPGHVCVTVYWIGQG